MKKGFTLIELLVVIAIIAILAAILFPVFAKAREKARQTTCTSNQKQMATAVAMWTQENDEKMPPASENWASEIGTTGKILQCPTAGKKIANAYAYNKNIAGLGLGEIQDPVSVALTADCDKEGNIMAAPSHVALRHAGKAIISFVDSHVEYTGDILRVVFFSDNSLMNNLTKEGKTYPPNSAEWPLLGDDGKNGDFTIPAIPNNVWSSMKWTSSTGELELPTNESRSADYVLPLAKFNNGDGSTKPQDWWGFSIDFKLISFRTVSGVIDDAAGPTVSIKFSDALGNVVASLDSRAWGWDNNNYLKITAGSTTKTIFSGHKAADSKKVYRDMMGQTQKLSCVLTKDGDVTLSYAGYTVSGTVSMNSDKFGSTGTGTPKIDFIGNGGAGVTVLTKGTFWFGGK